MEENEFVLEIYKYNPLKVLGKHLVINVTEVKILMDIFKVEEDERKSLLERLIYYNELINEE